MLYLRTEAARFPRRLFPKAILFFALLLPGLVSGCTYLDDKVNFDLASQPTVYQNQWARRDAPVVHVQPAEATDTPLTALFMPFRVTQKISDPEMVGYSQARVVWQTWLNKRLFSVMEFAADSGPFRRDRAVALARAKGADLAIGGFVTYYYPGGSEADSQVALQVEIYDAASGQMIWSMGQSAFMPARQVNDYILFATETRGPSDPMYALAKAIAEDMGEILGRWTPTVGGPRYEDGDGQGARPVHPSF